MVKWKIVTRDWSLFHCFASPCPVQIFVSPFHAQSLSIHKRHFLDQPPAFQPQRTTVPSIQKGERWENMISLIINWIFSYDPNVQYIELTFQFVIQYLSTLHVCGSVTLIKQYGKKQEQTLQPFGVRKHFLPFFIIIWGSKKRNFYFWTEQKGCRLAGHLRGFCLLVPLETEETEKIALQWVQDKFARDMHVLWS